MPPQINISVPVQPVLAGSRAIGDNVSGRGRTYRWWGSYARALIAKNLITAGRAHLGAPHQMIIPIVHTGKWFQRAASPMASLIGATGW